MQSIWFLTFISMLLAAVASGRVDHDEVVAAKARPVGAVGVGGAAQAQINKRNAAIREQVKLALEIYEHCSNEATRKYFICVHLAEKLEQEHLCNVEMGDRMEICVANQRASFSHIDEANRAFGGLCRQRCIYEQTSLLGNGGIQRVSMEEDFMGAMACAECESSERTCRGGITGIPGTVLCAPVGKRTLAPMEEELR